MFDLKKEELPHYTYDDYVQWGRGWEVIAGIPYRIDPAPAVRHQQISLNIAWLLKEQLKECASCQALLPVDWKLDEETVVQPDVSVVCYEPSGNFITRAPHIIFEVLSPSTASKDRGLKYRLYQQEGVRYYVLVDGENESIQLFELIDGLYRETVPEEKLRFSLEECLLEFPISALF